MSDPDVTIARNRARFGTFSWQGQAPQYDQLGPPDEIVYRVFDADGFPVNTLLYYDFDGELAGILNHYPRGGPVTFDGVLQSPGDVNTTIRPDLPQVEIILVADAKRRWPHLRYQPGVVLEVDRTQAGLTTDSMDGNRRIVRLSAPNR